MGSKLKSSNNPSPGNLNGQNASRYDNPRGYPGLVGFSEKHFKHATEHKIESSLARAGCPDATIKLKGSSNV